MASKSGSTRVNTAKLVKTCEKLGLSIETKAGWFLAFNPGNRSQRLLVHTGKRGTNCIELVGFESEFAISHPCSPAKTMTQMLDCNLEEAVILRNFFKTARLLQAKVEVAPAPTEAPAPVVTPEAELAGLERADLAAGDAAALAS